MLIGEDFWHQQIIKDMEWKEINYRNFYTYKDMPINIYESLLLTTKRQKEKIAFIDNEKESYTYKEFLGLVNQCAEFLKDKYQIGKEKHVGLLLEADIDFCICFYAIAKLGAVCIPLPTKYSKCEINTLIDKSYLYLLIYKENFQEWVKEGTYKKLEISTTFVKYGLETYLSDTYNKDCFNNNGELEDDLIIMFTSGTTSVSKGVVLKNYNVMHAIISYQRILDIQEGDKTIIPIPIYHITGLVALLGLFIHVGGTIYLHRRYDARKVLQCIYQNNITFMHGSPTVFSKLLELKNEYPILRSLRMIGCGSSYTPLTKMKEFHQWLPYTKFQVIYGMTETASPALIFPYDSPTSVYATSAGLLIPGMLLKVIDDDGKELRAKEVGQIWIKGTNVTTRYYNIVSSTMDADYWLDTGDMGYYNEDGYIFIVDRKKDMINRGGEKIWCKDVEEAINCHPAVIESAVVAVKDEIYGEVAGAIIVLRNPITIEGLKQYLKIELAAFKIPKQILFVDEIYKTSGLKVDKKRIKTLFKENL